MTIAILAALAMFAQDVIAVPLTQAEARNRAWLSGILDTVGWFVAIATTFISVNTLQGHDTAQKVYVVLLVSVANLFGTVTGTKLGQRFVREDAAKTTLPDRVTAIERTLGQRNH